MRGFKHQGRRSMPSGRSFAAITAGALLLVAAFAPVSLAAAPNPSAGSATVDGDPSEWSLAADHFADMTDAGDAARPVRAKLYLRYDCDAEVLYALVLAQDGEQGLQTRPEEAYVRIDGAGKLVSGDSGNDGTPPDFAWVNGDGALADGFEASGSVAPGSHTIRAHILIADTSADGYTPMDPIGRTVPLVLECGDVAPTQGTGPTPTPSGDVAPTQGTGPTPTPSEAPVGNVGGATGRPRATLPPTDGLTTTGPSAAGDSTRLVLVFLAAALGGFALATPTRSRRARPATEESTEDR